MDSSLVDSGCLLVMVLIAGVVLFAGWLTRQEPEPEPVYSIDELKARVAALSAPSEPVPEPEEMIALDEIETFDPSESEAAKRAEAMMLTMVRVTHEVNEILVRCGF